MNKIKPAVLATLIIFLVFFFLFVKKSKGALECHGSGSTTYRNYDCDRNPYSGNYRCTYSDSTVTTNCRWWYNSCSRPDSIQYDDRCVSGGSTGCSWSGMGNHPETTSGCWTCENSCTPTCQGEWSGCSNSCGDGTQTRPNYCVAQCGNTVTGPDCVQNCCSCSESCSCDAPEPNWQSKCTPSCGQYVSDTTYGQRCGGSSCALSCSKTAGGNCADYRSSSLTSPADNSNYSNFVHDMPIPVSGFAKDTNGATDGVEDVHIYNGSSFWTSLTGNGITIQPNDSPTAPAGSFNGNLNPSNTSSLYTATGGRNGQNHLVTLDFWAVQTENNTCGNWKFATRTITLTNTPPSSPHITFLTSNGNQICQDNNCLNLPLLSYTPNNILRVKITVNDSDLFPTSPSGFQRLSDIQEVIFSFSDSDNSHLYYRVKYTDTDTDTDNNRFSLQEDGGDYVDSIILQPGNQSANYNSPTLTIYFNLDFKDFPKNQNFNSSVSLDVSDFAGANITQTVVNDTTLYPPYWYKLKNASLIKKGNLVNYLAYSPSPYDSDDTNQRYLIIGEAGVVSVEGNNITLGAPTEDVGQLISSKKWGHRSYQKQSHFFVEQYLAYSKARKAMKVVTDPNDIENNKINLLRRGNITIISGGDDPSHSRFNSSHFAKQNSVIIVRTSDDSDLAEVTFDLSTFNPAKNSLAIIAKKITFNDNTSEINGIFLASSFQLASEPSPHYSSNPLKITGNLSSFDEIVDTTVRRRPDINKPSIFIVFSPQMYLDLLPYLSVSSYDWTELSP